MSYYRLWTNTYDLTERIREAKNEWWRAGSGRGPTWLNCTIQKYSKQPHARLHHGVLPVSHWEGSAPLSACQYHVQLWAPQYEKDGDKLEGVQERWPRHGAQATQLPMCLFSLKNKRWRRDLTAVYSYLMARHKEGGTKLLTNTPKIMRTDKSHKENSHSILLQWF